MFLFISSSGAAPDQELCHAALGARLRSTRDHRRVRVTVAVTVTMTVSLYGVNVAVSVAVPRFDAVAVDTTMSFVVDCIEFGSVAVASA